MTLQNISRGDVGILLSISPANISPIILRLDWFYQNCQAHFGCGEHRWVKTSIHLDYKGVSGIQSLSNKDFLWKIFEEECQTQREEKLSIKYSSNKLLFLRYFHVSVLVDPRDVKGLTHLCSQCLEVYHILSVLKDHFKQAWLHYKDFVYWTSHTQATLNKLSSLPSYNHTLFNSSVVSYGIILIHVIYFVWRMYFSFWISQLETSPPVWSMFVLIID